MNQESAQHLSSLILAPADEHNRQLAKNVHPSDWKNPSARSIYDAVVIGGGTTGLVTAAGIAGLGGDVALIERHLMGGDCLNVGCVPSKALIRSARAAAEIRNAKALGINVDNEPRFDFPRVMERLRRLRSQISPNDSVHRFRDLGVDVFLGNAKFSGRDRIAVDNVELRFRKAVIATGASPFVPPIPGIEDAPVYTNETIFNLTELPKRLLVVGGGPIGSEMAQAFARLGSHVVQVEATERILSRDDSEAAKIVTDAFHRDGVELRTRTRLIRMEKNGGTAVAVLEGPDGESRVETDALLMAVGRKPNIHGLELDKAGVAVDEKGRIKIDDSFRTTNRRIYSGGDVASPYQFTHAGDAMARAIITNAFFFGRARHSKLIIPWTTYTSPEVAGVGLSLEEAKKRGLDAKEIIIDFNDLDRAILDGETQGFLKVVYGKKGRILGATIVAEHAGDMIGEVVMAMKHNISLGSIASIIHPYPTQGEALKKAGDAYRKTLLTPKTARLLRWILRRGK